MNTKKIKELSDVYESVVKVLDKKVSEDEKRDYGRIICTVKGWLQEYITEEIIKLSWEEIGGDSSRLDVNSKKQKIPILKSYIEKIKDAAVKKHILSNISDYYYNLSVDKQVFIDGTFVVGIECKAYTENAMLKSILIDFSLLKTVFPDIRCYLFQLERQLGGDYSELNKVTYGSTSMHTLLSYFPKVELNIFTFLEGERKVNHPLHKYEYFKPLKAERLKEAVTFLAADFKKFV